jgi:hypothetical protein
MLYRGFAVLGLLAISLSYNADRILFSSTIAGESTTLGGGWTAQLATIVGDRC